MSAIVSTLVRLEGRDALDLLHRISTQHLRELAAGACRTTLFCDFRGRVQHRVAVARTADGAVWLARPDAAGDVLIAAIQAQIFRDDVRIEDWSGRHAVLATPATDAPAGRVLERAGVPARIALGDIDWVVGPEPATPALDDAARIRLGVPRHAHEIRDDFNPFEIGLGTDVHLDKGCFTGQEALLRMMTYGGVRRRLALLEGPGAPPALGDAVRRAGANAGVVTSVANAGPRWVALAVVARDALATGEALAAGDALASGSATITRAVAFPDARPLGLPDAPAQR